MQKTLDQVVAILGVLWANAIFVPIHPVLHAEQIGHMVDDCDMKFLITDSTRIAEFRDAAHGRFVGDGDPAFVMILGYPVIAQADWVIDLAGGVWGFARDAR